ncbi:MAG: DUF58 domain-containing protein, partial [Methanoregulaceae archaeon]|nr:DUF58 domain-containing protein [Methanoregulaceae archaeon]
MTVREINSPGKDRSDQGGWSDIPKDRKELIRLIEKIGIIAVRRTDGLLSGAHRSQFRGSGVDFTDLREYHPGDEIRAIDWNVTARQNCPFVREFTEDRDRTFYFVLDLSASGEFGSETSIRKRALEVTASLLFAAYRANDRIGLLLFSDRIERFIPAGRGRSHLITLLNTLVTCRPESGRTDLVPPLRFLARTLRRQVSIVLISDFNARGFSESLRLLGKRHEVIAVRITDPREHDL